ncbi:ubiquitin-conjugating enzyme e2 [Holotrichia oblita]|uniref:Ubiquitin-conjugating enzyme e2 n=2 Tax=Holotrichia oblita TaxID=644536 RepID=A0ACB9TJY0_HOLOL|nr:ubiquitin-conjugating enzyme e2 [Holotrichia oblita]KAI4467181.1 ubiquitin-conjugating enzyme e2 [Holotrichia oblita]
MQREQRLKRELSKIEKKPPKGISVAPKEDKLNILEASLIGPENSPYSDGLFKLEILIPDNYPFSPPSIKFLTKVYHPNIDDNGRICLDLIKMPPGGNWKPTIGIEGLLIAIQMLLQNPNPNDPLMVDIAEEFVNERKEFEKKAKLWCDKYARDNL